MKFNFLRFCFNKIDPLTCEEKLVKIKGKLYKLFEEYDKNKAKKAHSSSSQVGSSRAQQTSGSESLGKGLKGSMGFGKSLGINFATLDEYCQVEIATIGKSSLDLYLNEPVLDINFYSELDVLDYWNTQHQRYPDLSIMASNMLSIPITTVASESTFSISARILTKYRSSMLPENVKALVCTRNWLQRFD